MTTNKIKIIFLLLFSLIFFKSYASTIESVLHINQEIIKLLPNGVTIVKSNIGENFTNAENEDCIITTGSQQSFIKDIDKNMYFILTHEIAHCLLGKKIFTSPIKWNITLDNTHIDFLNLKIKEKTSPLKLSKNNQSVEPHPIVLYHEMFADTFAVIWLFQKGIINQSDINEIITIREFENNENYLTYKPLLEVKYLINNKKLKKMNVLDAKYLAELIVQKYFIKYLLD